MQFTLAEFSAVCAYNPLQHFIMVIPWANAPGEQSL